MARQAADGVRLSSLLEYPELSQPLPASQPLPSDYEKTFADIGIARIRRGPLSATLVLGGSSRVLALRYGDAVVEGVRFATSFFGKGQFIPETGAKQGSAYLFHQSLEAPTISRWHGRSRLRRGPRPGPSAVRRKSIASSRWPRSPRRQADVAFA